MNLKKIETLGGPVVEDSVLPDLWDVAKEEKEKRRIGERQQVLITLSRPLAMK